MQSDSKRRVEEIMESGKEKFVQNNWRNCSLCKKIACPQLTQNHNA